MTLPPSERRRADDLGPMEVCEAVCLRPGLRMLTSLRLGREAPWAERVWDLRDRRSDGDDVRLRGRGKANRVLGQVALWGGWPNAKDWRASRACRQIGHPECRRRRHIPDQAIALDLTDYGVSVSLAE
jgi:hypothetical protein